MSRGKYPVKEWIEAWGNELDMYNLSEVCVENFESDVFTLESAASGVVKGKQSGYCTYTTQEIS